VRSWVRGHGLCGRVATKRRNEFAVTRWPQCSGPCKPLVGRGSELLRTDGRKGDLSAGARRHTLSLIGELDQRTARVLDAEIERLCEEDVAGITLDLRELTYIDSTGIALIAVRCQLCRKRGRDFALIPGSRSVNRAFGRAGVSHLLPVQEDEILIRRSRPRCSVEGGPVKSLGGWLLSPSPATVQGSAEVQRGSSQRTGRGARAPLPGVLAPRLTDERTYMTASLLHCLHCHFSVRPRATFLAREYCPRCLARRRVHEPLCALPHELADSTPTVSRLAETSHTKLDHRGPVAKSPGQQSAVTQTLRRAQEAAHRGAFSQALEWLSLVELVDGGLPADWGRTRESWHLMATQQP